MPAQTFCQYLRVPKELTSFGIDNQIITVKVSRLTLLLERRFKLASLCELRSKDTAGGRGQMLNSKAFEQYLHRPLGVPIAHHV